jgi:hypothetical protein
MKDASLPEDPQACHAMIGRLRRELAECRRKLAVYAENERVEIERRYGKGATAQGLVEPGRAMSAPLADAQRETIEAELAAEDAMRRRRSNRRKKREIL